MFFWIIAILPIVPALSSGFVPAYGLWMAFAVPALGYSIWRWRSGYAVCGKCNTPLDANWQPTNRPAVAGFLFGLMLQIPLVSGIVALILGGIGRGRAKVIGSQGESLAKLAQILGIVNIVGWMIVSITISFAWRFAAHAPRR
jgi:hypothetical protein